MNSQAATLIQGHSIKAEVTAVPFIVGFFFAFRLMIMLLSVRIFGMEPQTGTTISLGLNLLLPLIVAFECLGSADRTFASMLRPWSIRWAFVFLIFSGFSLTWSAAAAVPAAAAYWCGNGSRRSDSGSSVSRQRHPRHRMRALIRGFVWGASVALIAWLLPAQSDLRLGDEELLGPNQFGYLCASALFFVQYLTRREGRELELRRRITRSHASPHAEQDHFGKLLSSLSSCSFALDSSMKRKTKAILIGGASCGPRVLESAHLLLRHLQHLRQQSRDAHRPHRDLGLHSQRSCRQPMDRPRFLLRLEGHSTLRYL